MTLGSVLINKLKKFKLNIIKLIPAPNNEIPLVDTNNGNKGKSPNYARSDHQHPKSTLYAEANHSHNQYFDTAGTGLTKSDTTLSADIGNSSNTSASKLVACNDSRLSDARTPTNHNQDLSTINNTSTLAVTITYTDDSTETKNIVIYTPPSS